MFTSHYEWEEWQTRRRVEQSLNAMVAPSVEDAADLAALEKRRPRTERLK